MHRWTGPLSCSNHHPPYLWNGDHARPNLLQVGSKHREQLRALISHALATGVSKKAQLLRWDVFSCCGMRKAEATSVTALLRLLWQTQSFSLSSDDSKVGPYQGICAVQWLFLKSLSASANQREMGKGEGGGAAGHRGFKFLCELT